jgi:hypothetical protein
MILKRAEFIAVYTEGIRKLLDQNLPKENEGFFSELAEKADSIVENDKKWVNTL